jgi:DNA/RNA-binding domain of Phe-tRNA-synthetase-like protein
MLADRATGARAVAMRTQPLGHAYRSFFRHIGLDPDVTRVPSEALAMRRLLEGGLPSQGLVEDAITVAVAETGIPVWAVDGERVEPATLCVRTAEDGERAAKEPLAAGELVVADAHAPLARLFGEIKGPFRPRPGTRQVVLFAVGVDGVPAMFLEEALWLATEMLGEG